jgi:hypothetical protein
VIDLEAKFNRRYNSDRTRILVVNECGKKWPGLHLYLEISARFKKPFERSFVTTNGFVLQRKAACFH